MRSGLSSCYGLCPRIEEWTAEVSWHSMSVKPDSVSTGSSWDVPFLDWITTLEPHDNGSEVSSADFQPSMLW